MKRKLAFVATSYIKKYDGVSVYAENLLQEIINLISREKKEILIDVFVQEGSLDLLKSRISIPQDIYEFAKINFIAVKGSNFPLRMLNLIRLILKKGKYDLIYMTNPMPIIFPSTKTIRTIHDFSFKIAPEYYSTFVKIYSDFLKKIAIKFDILLGYISETSKKDFEKFYGINENYKKFLYLPNGIPFKVQKLERPPLEYIEKKFLDKDLKIIVVGRINRHKGFDRILKFIKYVDSLFLKDGYFKKIEVNMVGKKTPETDIILNNYTPQNVKLNFLGYLPDEQLNELYKKSHFCFFLSRNEGYGLPLVESLWMRTIPILSDIPIFKEIMGDDYPLLFGNDNYEKEIYNYIKKTFEDKNFLKNLSEKIDKVVEKEKKGYKIAAKNLIEYLLDDEQH